MRSSDGSSDVCSSDLTARTWVNVADGVDNADMRSSAALANAYLLARDQLVGAMSERTRRLVYGRCLGRTQRALAEAEGITQSAVSQALAVAGAGAIVEGFAALNPGGIEEHPSELQSLNRL